MREQQTLERLKLELGHANARAIQFQALAIKSEQESVRASYDLAQTEKRLTSEMRRLGSVISEQAMEHEAKVAEMEQEMEQMSARLQRSYLLAPFRSLPDLMLAYLCLSFSSKATLLGLQP